MYTASLAHTYVPHSLTYTHTTTEVTVGVLEEAAKLGISRLWLQPGCDDAAVLAKAKELGLEDSLIHGGPCVLVQLGYNDAWAPLSASSSASVL